MERDFLNNFTKQIERVDNEILILLKRRFQLIKKVAKYRKDHNIEAKDLNEETMIFSALSSRAITMDLSESFIRKLFQSIIDESNLQERDYLSSLEK